jgi:hypothetical protein
MRRMSNKRKVGDEILPQVLVVTYGYPSEDINVGLIESELHKEYEIYSQSKTPACSLKFLFQLRV